MLHLYDIHYLTPVLHLYDKHHVKPVHYSRCSQKEQEHPLKQNNIDILTPEQVYVPRGALPRP